MFQVPLYCRHSAGWVPGDLLPAAIRAWRLPAVIFWENMGGGLLLPFFGWVLLDFESSGKHVFLGGSFV